MYHSFENLNVWKKAYHLVIQIYSSLSGTKEYFIKDQMLRSALSIPSNIAEGA
jgi:four helix bundle protein